MAVLKSEDPITQDDCELQAKECMLFAGTAVTNGSCTAIVTHTGMRTEMGKIQSDIQAAGEEDQDTPLKKKLNEFGEMLAQVRVLYSRVVFSSLDHFFERHHYSCTLRSHACFLGAGCLLCSVWVLCWTVDVYVP